MAGMNVSETRSRTLPVWVGDELSREHVLPGGIRLKASAFPAKVAGRKQHLASGTPITPEVVANVATGLWIPADSAPAGEISVVRLTVYDIPDLERNADAEVYRPGGLVYFDRLPGNLSGSTLPARVTAALNKAYDMQLGGE